ncbi:MAG: hypothetical protein NC452_12690 [Eubacterium sp.]|nr:hypothetical protein [Eubacterium sp.]
MYEIQNPILFDNLNEYFVCEKQNGTGLYFSSFLCRYEKTLNVKVKRFLRYYSLSDDHLEDLKQIFAEVLWSKLKEYNSDNGLPFLQFVKYDVLHAWHSFVSTSCGTITIRNDKLYALVRKAARIYYSMPESNIEKITAVKNQLSISESKAREYIQYAEQFRFSVSLDLDGDNSENEPVENKIIERSPSAEDEFFRFCRRQIISETAAKLSYKELRILTETIGVCPFCFHYIPKSERKTCEELALILGYSGGDVVERLRRKIFDRVREALRTESF